MTQEFIRVQSTPKVPEYLNFNTAEKQTDQLALFCRKPPKQEQLHVVLPTYWNSKDKSQHVELAPGNTKASYTGFYVDSGSGKTDLDAACVRSNVPIDVSCGIYYFEVTIVSKGRDGYIAVGFQAGSVPLGWEDNSWGYHGDDGHSFCCTGTGKSYGPTFTTGDVIGCVINFIDNSASFTKNGMLLGVAFPNMLSADQADLKLFPAVGLRTPGEVIQANFGAKPFRFDIVQYYRDEYQHLYSSIDKTPLNTNQVEELVLSYLVHEGYTQAAKSFYAATRQASFSQFKNVHTLEKRQLIINLIVRGEIDAAVKEISLVAPRLLESYPNIRLALMCLKFIGLVVKERGMQLEQDQEELLRFGQQLLHDYPNATELEETFSLACFPNPDTCPVSYLTRPEIRANVAQQVNEAIIGQSTNKETHDSPVESALVKTLKQLRNVNRRLVEVGSGAGGMLERNL